MIKQGIDGVEGNRVLHHPICGKPGRGQNIFDGIIRHADRNERAHGEYKKT
jgi:hypothetical protein